MANHTQTNLTVTGPKEEILAFVNAVDKGPDNHFDFNSLIPRPKHESASASWAWAFLAWGTKHSAYEAQAWELGTETAWITYQTAWSPATQFFLNVSEKFSQLQFKHEFADEGCDFIGSETISQGKLVESKRFEWDSPEGEALQKELGVYAGDEVAEEEARN